MKSWPLRLRLPFISLMFAVIGFVLLTSCEIGSIQPAMITPDLSVTITGTPHPFFTRTPTPFFQPTSTKLAKVPGPTSTPTQSHWQYVPPKDLILAPFPAAPTPDSGVSYNLVQPSTQDLSNLLVMANDRYVAAKANLRYSRAGDEDPRAGQISHEAESVLPWIEFDFGRYEAVDISEDSLAVADHVIGNWREISNDLPHWGKSYLNQWLIRNLSIQPIQFEAKQLYELSSNITLYPIPLELDGDSDSEWIVEAHIHRIDYQDYPYDFFTWLLLDRNPSGIYEALPNDILETFEDPEFDEDLNYELDASYDFNGDGINDVSLSKMTYSAGGISGYVFIYMWDGSKLAYTTQIRLPSINPDYGEVNFSTYEIQDYDHDGKDELRITWPRFGEFGCNWQTIRTYDWNGTEFEPNVQKEEVPVDSGKPECYITQALWSPDPAEKTRWFETALKALPSSALTDLRVWVMLRLMAAYLGQDRTFEAEQTLQQLEQISGEGNFLAATQKIISSTDPDPIAVCKAMYMLTREQSQAYKDFDSEIDHYLNFAVYPLSLYPDADKVCPYEDISYDQLLSQHLSANQPPQTAYNMAGFDLQYPAGFNIDSDPELEWIAIFEKNLTYFDAMAGEWQAKYIRYIYLSVQSLQAAPADTNGDGINELLVVIDSPDQDFLAVEGTCDPDERSYMTLIVDPSKGWFERFRDQNLYCLSSPPDLSTAQGMAEVLALIKNRGMPELVPSAWISMTGFVGKPETDQDIYEYITEQKENILGGNDLEASRSRIKALIAYIPPDDPIGVILINELKYLVGMSYELEGQTEKAVAEYLQLIKDAPTSPFSWLAWTRLEPV